MEKKVGRIYIDIILFITAIAFIGCSSSQKTDVNIDGAEVRLYEVFGMDCHGCHGGIEKLLNKHIAIINSKADWVNKNITLYISEGSGINEEEIFEIIKSANFTPGKRIK